MFLLLLGLIRCEDEDFNPEFYCFSTKEKCALYEEGFGGYFEVIYDDLANLDKYLEKLGPFIVFIFPESPNKPITLDFTSKSFNQYNIFILGNDEHPQVTIKIGNTESLQYFNLYKTVANIELVNNKIDTLQAIDSNVTINIDCDVESLAIDRKSHILGNHIATITLEAEVELNYDKTNILLETKDVTCGLPESTRYIEVDTKYIKLYENKEEHELTAIEINESEVLSFFSSFFNLDRIINPLIIDIYMKDPNLPADQYRKLQLYAGYYASIRFTGVFPKTPDSIFSIETMANLIINSSYVPLYNRGESIYLQTAEFDALCLKKQSYSIAIYSHDDFKSQRIKINIHDNEQFQYVFKSPNFDVIFEKYQVGQDISMAISENEAPHFKVNEFIKNPWGLNIYIYENFPAFFSDETLQKYVDPVTLVTINSTSEELFANIHCSFQNFEKLSFLNEIFTFNSEIIDDEIVITMKKTKIVPKFTPDICICDTKCKTNPSALWFKKSNISDIYNYIFPDGNTTITFESNILTSAFNFSKLPKFDEYSFLVFASLGHLEINVVGSMDIHQLNLEKIKFNPIEATNYNINYLTLSESSSLFNEKSTYSVNIVTTVDLSSASSIPSDIVDKTLMLSNGNFYFTEELVKIKSQGIIYDLTNDNFKIYNSNIFYCYMNDTKPIIEAKFSRKKLVALYMHSVRLEFKNNWENCIFDFFDFSEMKYDEPVYVSGELIPFIDFNGTKWDMLEFYGSENICLVPNSSVQAPQCGTNDKIFTINDGLRYLENIKRQELNISIYQSDRIINFTAKHLRSKNILISSDSMTNKIRLPNIPPTHKQFYLNNFCIVLDSKEDFILHGYHINNDIEKAETIGNCYYYMDAFEPSIYNQFTVTKHSVFYRYCNANISELPYSIILYNFNSFSSIQFDVQEKEDIDVSIDPYFCGYGLKSKSLIKLYFQRMGLANFHYELTIMNSINVNVTSTTKNISLKVSGIPLKIILNSPLDIFYSSVGSGVYITDKSGSSWGILNIKGDLYLETDVLNVETLFFDLVNHIFAPGISKCKINANLLSKDGDLIFLGSNIELNVSSINCGTYPLVHQFDLKQIASVTAEKIFLSAEDFIIHLKPDFIEATDEDLMNFKTPINIVNIDTTQRPFNDKYDFIESNVYGFMNGASVVNISHSDSAITFAVDKKLDSLEVDLCYAADSTSCSDKYTYINALTTDEIEKAAGEISIVNIYIMESKVDNLNLAFTKQKYFINFIHLSETKCEISIDALRLIYEFSFTNFIITASNDYHLGVPAKYIKCQFGELGYQSINTVQADIESLASLYEKFASIESVIIDYKSKITYYNQIIDTLLINDLVIPMKMIKSVTLDQRSLVSGMTLSFYDVRSRIYINTQSDFELKITGRFNAMNTGIQLKGKGILTCNVIESTKDFAVDSLDNDRIIKKLVETSKMVINVMDKCNEGSIGCVVASDLGDTINRDETHDIIEVQVAENLNPLLKSSQLKGKNVHFTSLSKSSINLEIDANSDLVMINLTNIVVILTANSGFELYSMSLTHSRITCDTKDVTINTVKYLEFDLYYMVPAGCPQIGEQYTNFLPYGDEIEETSNFRINSHGSFIEFIFKGNTDIGMIFELNTLNVHFFNNGKEVMKILASSQDLVKFIKDDSVKLNFKVENSGLEYDFSPINTTFAFSGDVMIKYYLPQKMVLLGNGKVTTQVHFLSDVEISSDVDNRVELIFSNAVYLIDQKIKLGSGNVDLILESELSMGLTIQEIPIELIMDEKGISTFSINAKIELMSEADFTILPLRIGYKFPPSDKDLQKLNTGVIASFLTSFTDKYPTILKYIYDFPYHGLWEGNSVLNLESTNEVKLILTIIKNVDGIPMKICVGSDPKCPSESMIIENDFSLSNRVSILLKDLEILATKNNKVAIDCEFRSSLRMTIKSLDESNIAEATLKNVNLNIETLRVEKVKLNANEFILDLVNLYIEDSQIPNAVYTFKEACYATIDYEALKIINGAGNFSRLNLEKSTAKSIIFTSEGWILDGLIIKKTELYISYNFAMNDNITLSIEEGNDICNGFEIRGTFPLLHCSGAESWRSVKIVGEIRWRYYSQNVVLKSDTFFNPIKLIGSGTVTYDLAPIPPKTSLCFHDGDSTKCASSKKYLITDFNATMLNTPEISINIEIATITTSKIGLDVSALDDKFIEIQSLGNKFTIEAIIDDSNHDINELALNNIIFDIKGSYNHNFSIKTASFTNSKLITDDFTKDIIMIDLKSDQQSLPAKVTITEKCVIEYSEGEYAMSSITLQNSGIKVYFNGFSDQLKIEKKFVDPLIEVVVNDKVSLIVIDRISPDITFTDNNENKKKVTLTKDENSYYATDNIALNMTGITELTISGNWKNSPSTTIAMTGTIIASGGSLDIYMKGPIELIARKDLEFSSIHLTSNLTVSLDTQKTVSFYTAYITEGSFINLMSEKLNFVINYNYPDKKVYDVFPVTFAVTDEGVSSLEIKEISFTFNTIQVTCVADHAPKSKSQTIQMIKTSSIVQSASLMLISNNRYLGYWNQTSSLSLDFISNGVNLIYSEFSDQTLFLCFTDTCINGPVVTPANILSMIPEGHKLIDITVPTTGKTDIILPSITYDKISIQSSVEESLAEITLAPNTINKLELTNIKIPAFECTGANNFHLILNHCELTGITNVKETHQLTSDFSSFKKLDGSMFKIISLIKLQDALTFEFGNETLVIDNKEINAKSISVSYTQNTGKLAFNLVNTFGTLTYSFLLYTLSDSNIVLGGEWHKIEASDFKISHGSNVLILDADESYSDPFVIIGDGQVTKNYKQRGKQMICACNDACNNCPDDNKIYTFDDAKAAIEGVKGEEASLEIYISGSTADKKLIFDISSNIMPEISIKSLVAGVQQYASIEFNTNYVYDRLSFNNVAIASSSSSLETKEIAFSSSSIVIQKIEANKANLDSIDIGISEIYVYGSVSIQSGFSTISHTSETVMLSDDGKSITVRGTQTVFDLTFDKADGVLKIADQDNVETERKMNFILKSESRVIMESKMNMNFVTEEKTIFEIKANVNGIIEAKKYVEIELHYTNPSLNKLIISGEAKIINKNNDINTFTINEIVINGNGKVIDFGSLNSLKLNKLTIEDQNRVDFPFVFTFQGIASQLEIDDFSNSKATSISLDASELRDITNLLSDKNKIIVFKTQQNIQYSMKWITSKQLHGMWDGNSIFEIENNPTDVTLSPKNSNLEDLPAEVCVYDTDESVCSASSIRVKPNEKIDSNLFPPNLKSFKIIIYPESYIIDHLISMKSGSLFEIRGANKQVTLSISKLILDSFEKVNLVNLKYSCQSTSIARSEIDLTGTVFNDRSIIDFDQSKVSLDYEAFSSSFIHSEDNLAKNVKISGIPSVLSINDANGRFPYITHKLPANLYEWIGSNDVSIIDFVYGTFEQAAQKNKFILLNDAEITIKKYQGADFFTNMEFITNSHKVTLKGISFIPPNLFSNVSDVTLYNDPEPLPGQSVIVVSGNREGQDIHANEFKPSKTGSIRLVGGENNNADYSANIIIDRLEIDHQTQAEANKLFVKNSILIKGESTLKPMESGKIDIEHNQVDITFEAVGVKLPLIDLGEVGANYANKPKSFKIVMDLTGLSNEEISNEYRNGKAIMSGRTLKSDEWIQNIDISQISGNKDFIFELSYISNSRLLSSYESSIVLISNEKQSPIGPDGPGSGSKGLLITIIIIVVVVVLIIVIIVVIVVVCKKRRANRSSSNSSSSDRNNKETEI